jgi:hypothetical protein
MGVRKLHWAFFLTVFGPMTGQAQNVTPDQPGLMPGSNEVTATAATTHRGAPPLGALAPGWNTIHPGGPTTCLYGTEYGYFVKPGDPARVMISFPGGAACWSGPTCSNEPQGRVDEGPKTIAQDDNPAGTQGIFAEGHPDNPFTGFTYVHVGYCTGDMHIGDAVRPNEGWIGQGQRPSDELHFNGYRNAMTVLEWVFRELPAPELVVVGGYTSGSYGTPLYVSLVADHYPDAVVRHIGDGNGALHVGPRISPLIDAWDSIALLRRHSGFEGIGAPGFNFEDITIAAARRHPEIVFTQAVTARDAVFSELLAYLGVDVPILEVIEAGQRHVRGQVENYRSFVAGGDKHILGLGYFDSIPQRGNRNRGLPDIYDRFYSYAVNGRRYRDWVADLLAGRPVEDVRCGECAGAEYFVPE